MTTMIWKQEEGIRDDFRIIDIYTAVGYEYTYELHIERNGPVSVSVWADIAATRFDPPDVECFAEETFNSEAEAKAWADHHDAEAKELALAYEKALDERP